MRGHTGVNLIFDSLKISITTSRLKIFRESKSSNGNRILEVDCEEIYYKNDYSHSNTAFCNSLLL